ncbi:MAG: 50S ribosomal protein L3 [Deltaproteobacteria bacterium]|nr:50S ribosomal protein L3 [Deltaproteobacteria bacterium]
MSGLIGKKVGMTSVFDASGNHVPVTVIEVDPNVVTQVKTAETDGYSAVQLSAFEKREKSTTKALKGHFAKANTSPKKFVSEFRDYGKDGIKLGDVLTVADIFSVGDSVNVVGTSIGKGFQGVVKRHGFAGVGGRTHGQHNRARHPGSIGQASDPSRVFKGIKMGGRMGFDRVKKKNAEIIKIIAESNLILVEGPIPGPAGRMVEIHNR